MWGHILFKILKKLDKINVLFAELERGTMSLSAPMNSEVGDILNKCQVSSAWGSAY